MELKELPTEKVFTMYQADLILRIGNQKNLKSILNFLSHFREYLGEFPPSSELAKSFLSQYKSTSPHTFYNYVGEIKRFMQWYGEPLNVKAKLPKILPTYHEDTDIEKLYTVIDNKKTHKGSILRDRILVELGIKTGMRRAELANLESKDVHSDFLIILNGKGGKDRYMPLAPDIAQSLKEFIKAMAPEAKVFGLNPTSLGMKIKDLANRAGLKDFHCHSMRHIFATRLLESGANIKEVQELLGHENLNTTQVYLSVKKTSLHDAVKLLEKKPDKQTKESASPDFHIVPVVPAGTAAIPASILLLPLLKQEEEKPEEKPQG